MLKSSGILAAFALTLAIISCKSSTTGANGVVTSSNKVSFTAGGTALSMTATANKQVSGGTTTYTIGGADTSGKGFTISLVNIPGNGTYDIGKMTPSGSSFQFVTMTYIENSSTTYVSGDGTTSVGTINVSNLSSSNVAATFNVTMKANSGSGTLSITNGSVNVNY